MADITATKNPSDLHDVLGKVTQVLLNKEINKLPSALTSTFDFKLPVLADSLTFNMGEAEVSRIKLIDETNWLSYSKKGDPDISFQVPSFSPDIAELLGNKIDASEASTAIGMTLQGYSATPKKVICSLLFLSDDGLVCVYLPNVEIFATPVMGDGENPAYFNCVLTPVPDSKGADYYIGRKTATGA